MSIGTDQLPALTNGRTLTVAHPRTAADVIGSLDDILRLGAVLVKSRMLPSSITTPEAAAAIILKGRELGIGPMEAFSGITVIQGKPTVSPQLMLSLINRSGLMADMAYDDDGNAARVTMRRKGQPSPHTETFSMEDARKLQLAGKDNWNKQPRTMRKWRAIAACARIKFPDVIAGMYTHEELGAEVDEDGEIIDVPVVPAPADLGYDPEPAPRTSASDPAGSPAGDRAYREWAASYCRKVNEAWTARHPGLDTDRELVRPDQLHRHLYKVLEGVETTAGVIYNHLIRALAVRYGDDPAAVVQAARGYVARLAEEAEAELEGRAPDRDPADDADPDAPDGEPALDPDFDPTSEPGHDDQ